MKRSRFVEEQIIAVLQEQEARAKAADVYRRNGISNATFYNWKVIPSPINLHMSCPHWLRASMITAGGNKASAVIMDCRDKPGNDNEKNPSL